MNSCWCLECKAAPVAACEGQHTIVDRMEDVEEIKALQTQVAGTLSQAIEKRQKIETHLQTVTTMNDDLLKKLRSLAGKKKLPVGRTSSGSIKKMLEDLQHARDEVEEANKMWIDVTGEVITNLIFSWIFPVLVNLKYFC